MYNSFCISTTTPGLPIYINGSPTSLVTDENGNTFMATTSCPSVVSYVQHQVDNPAQDMFNGVILFFAFFAFIVWYFVNRFRQS